MLSKMMYLNVIEIKYVLVDVDVLINKIVVEFFVLYLIILLG